MRCWSVGIVVVGVLFAGLLGCSRFSRHDAGKEKACAPAEAGEPAVACEPAEAGEPAVALSEVPTPARDTILRLTAGGHIRKLEKEEVGGVTIYDVEAQVRGKDVEYDVDSSGHILTSERSVEYASLPPAVRAAAEGYFGSSQGLKASQEIEGDKTFYEVEGMKGTARRELKLTESGQIAEEEEGD